MTDDVNVLSDETLFEICRVSQQDLEAMPALAEELRLARRLVPPPRLRHDGRIEHAVALLASAMGRMPKYNPTHLPFGYQGPIIKSSGWLDRDDLDLVAKQIVGLTWIDSKPDDVACVVGQAISKAVSLSLIEQTKYDAWRPGMASGSGWREAVSATTYGVAKARAMGERQVEATAQSPTSSAPVQRPTQNPPWAQQPKSEAADGRNSSFCRVALENLKRRAEGYAKQYPSLQHMLVLPEGEYLRVPPPPGVHPLGSSSYHVPPAVTFGESKVAAVLPPEDCWPRDLEPIRAVVAEQEFGPYRPLAQKPYRVHLFFGNPAGMAALQSLAADLVNLSSDVGRAIFRSQMLDTVFFHSPDCLHGKDAEILDAWLCTVHWWAWKAVDSPIHTQPRVVFGGSALPADRRDHAVDEKLSFSVLDCDIFAATVATIDLFFRFFKQPPDMVWPADYPPEPRPEDTAPAGNGERATSDSRERPQTPAAASNPPVQRPTQNPPWAQQPKTEASDGLAQVKEAAPAQAPRDLISRKTRIEFREFLVSWSLREISNEFAAADIAPDKDFVPDVSGQRRSLVEQYYHTLDFTGPADVQKLVQAYENILTSALNKAAKIESDGYPDPSLATQLRQAVNSLSAWLKKDGFTFENGKLRTIDTEAEQPDEPISRTITEVTRRDIFDALRMDNVQWAGRLSEIKFLSRLYDLEAMPPDEPRFDCAAEEIWQHRVNNPLNWPGDWVFTDSRFTLTDGPDDTFLRFLCEMVHPLVQPDQQKVESLVAMFNEHLAADGWEIVRCREISSKPVFGPRRISESVGPGAAEAKTVTGPMAPRSGQLHSRSAVDASASQQSAPLSWQDSPAPHLPSEMEPFDKALAEMLLRLPTMWASVDFERFTNTQEKALARLVEAGLVEERVVATAWMDGFSQVAILRGRVTGDFKRKLLWESAHSVPEWLTKDGKTRGRYSFWYDVTEVRLTDAGETARHDWNSPKPSFVLTIVRGIGGQTRGISPDGIVQIEERKVETREKPPAPSDVRALLREGFALNRVPTSDEVDAGTAIASAKKVIDEPVERTISEVTRRNIFDALRINNVQWAGRLSETEFLAKLYDLDSMPSTDHRFRDAAGDIAQHRVLNPDDWPDDWVYSDSRFDLTNGPDETFLRFLCEMVHPLVQPDKEVVDSLVAMFNKHVAADGWEIVRCREISSKPVFGPRQIIRGAGEVQATCGMAVDGGIRAPKLGEEPRSAQRQSERQDPNDDLVELLDDANYCIMALADLRRDYGIIAAASSRTEGGSEDWHFVDHRDESEYREAHRRIKPTMDVLPRRMKQVLRWGLRHGFEVSEDLGFLTYDRASAGVKADACRDYELAIRGVMNAMLAEQTRARIAESVGCGELGASATDQVFEDSPNRETADKPELDSSTEPQADTPSEFPDEPFGPPRPPGASGGMDAWIKAEMERIRQEDDGPYMTPPPSTEARDVRVLWIENAARDLAQGFANTLAERGRLWVRIQDADRAQNPADREVACHAFGRIDRMLQAQQRLARRVFNQAVILLPMQATADAEIIRNLPSEMTPEQVRQAKREWNRITDAAVRERNATAQAAPVGQDAAADADNWVFEDLPDGEVQARNRRLCERYAALNLEDLLLLCHQWRQMAVRFTAATKKAGKYHGHVVHDQQVQEVTKILETAMVSRVMEGTNRLSRCLRRPDDGHLHNALAALDDLEAKLRLETCESGVLRPISDVEAEVAGSDPQQSKPPKTVDVQAPPEECYAEIDVRSADKGFLCVLFKRKNTDGRPTAACDPISVDGQLLAILVAGRDMALRKLREAEDALSAGELADDYKTILEWTQDSLQDYVKGTTTARRKAIGRIRRLVKFQDCVGLVTHQDKDGTWRSVVEFRLRRSGKL